MKQNFKKLLELNLEINSLLKTEGDEPDEKLSELLQEKDAIIENLKKIKDECPEEYENLKNNELKESWLKIQQLEKENLKLILQRRDKMRDQINKIKKHIKTIGSYKFKKEQEPRLFDDSG